MKTTFCAGLLLSAVAISVPAQPSPTTAIPAAGSNNEDQFSVIEAGLNHRVWQRVEWQTLPTGKRIPRFHRYTELASGLHYIDDTGQYAESKEIIEGFPGGAVARYGQTKVIFANNLAEAAADIFAADGVHVQTRILGLAYLDLQSGTNVLIAEIKDCQGQIINPNQVIYPDAFTGVKASVHYTYHQSGLEQDIIIEAQLPRPEDCGMNAERCVLGVLTEFDSPEPGSVTQLAHTETGAPMRDQHLDFGALKIGVGKAFEFGLGGSSPEVRVFKQWVNIEGRRVLLEQVPITSVWKSIQKLPGTEGASTKQAKRLQSLASLNWRPPSKKLSKASNQTMRVASLSGPERGVVIDYSSLTGSLTNYVFAADTTYFVSGTVYLYGQPQFEGGAVLKYGRDKGLTCVYNATPNFRTSQYRPVIFTAKDDNSIGELIAGSTGNPTGCYAIPALGFGGVTSPQTISHVRFLYAQDALMLAGASVTLYDAQFLNCQKIAALAGSTLKLRNALCVGIETAFDLNCGCTADVQNGTFLGCLNLTDAENANGYPCGSVLNLTNSILASVTNAPGNAFLSYSADHNGFYATTPFGGNIYTSSSYPFQTAGAGNFYLANGSIFRNAGTANIDQALLSKLAKQTTYPPTVISRQLIGGDLAFSPIVQRDTDIIDLGYHYEPLDYILGMVYVTNSTISVAAGTALGSSNYFSGGYALGVGNGASLKCQGTPLNPVHIAGIATIQEQPMTNRVDSHPFTIASGWCGGTVQPKFSFLFTKLYTIGQQDALFTADWDPAQRNFQKLWTAGGGKKAS